jgi:WD40 repeat protein
MRNRKLLQAALIGVNVLALAVMAGLWRGRGSGTKPLPVEVLEGHRHWVYCVAFAPDGKTLVSGGGNFAGAGEVRWWDLSRGKARPELPGPKGRVAAAVFSPDGRLLATAAEHTVQLWEASTGRQRAAFGVHKSPAVSLAFSQNGKVLIAAGLDETVQSWDVATGKEQVLFRGTFGPKAVSADGRLVAMSSSQGGNISVWDVAGRREQTYLPQERNLVFAVAFSPDARLLASADFSGTVHLWDTTRRELRCVLKAHQGSVNCLTFSPDGRTLATGGQDRLVKLWDVAAGEEKTTLVGHTGPIEALDFAPNGRRLASGSYDKTVRIWDLAEVI